MDARGDPSSAASAANESISEASDATVALTSVAAVGTAARSAARKPRWLLATMAVCMAVIVSITSLNSNHAVLQVILEALVLVVVIVALVTYRRRRRATTKPFLLFREKRGVWFIVTVVLIMAANVCLFMLGSQTSTPWWVFCLAGVCLGAILYTVANWSWNAWVREVDSDQ